MWYHVDYGINALAHKRVSALVSGHQIWSWPEFGTLLLSCNINSRNLETLS